MLIRLAVFSAMAVGLLLTGCQAPSAELDSGREIRGQAALTDGTCLGACGGKSYDGNCWCDEACASYGDCCADHADVCSAPGTKKPTCEDACGGKSKNGNCWCDEACEGYGDCCADAADLCSEPVCPEAMCKMYCEFGNQVDANGCQICACNPRPFCGGIAGFPCPEGYVCQDDPNDECDPANGGADCGGLCFTAPVCPEVMCLMWCEHGSVEDDNGCATCNCKKCDELSNPKVVVHGKSLEECMVMKFACDPGYMPYFNDCGCGCVPEPVPAGDSCQDRCGQTSSAGTCWCDGACASYGDCCADVATWCE